MKQWSNLKKTILISAVALFALAGIGNLSQHKSALEEPVSIPTAQPTTSSDLQTQDQTNPASIKVPTSNSTSPSDTSSANSTAGTGATDSNLSNDNSYTNSDGNIVHSPADSTDGSVPIGATARCIDGSFSFSQHHSGTCSHHGGVADWL